ncbi:hypothetical protein FBU59_006814, partial [Linderina macrospora]
YDNRSAVDLRVNYIATLNGNATYGANCLHGDIECLGNIQQLCVQDKSTTEDTLEFVLCQQRSVDRIGSWSHFAGCLRPLSQWQQILRCAATDEGKRLLAKSAEYSMQHNAKTSLTFQLNGVQRCVFDEGAWKKYEEDCPGGYSVPLFSKSIRTLAMPK